VRVTARSQWESQPKSMAQGHARGRGVMETLVFHFELGPDINSTLKGRFRI